MAATGIVQHGRSFSSSSSHHDTESSEKRVLSQEHSLDSELPTISVKEMHYRIAVQAGGGIWRGLFKSFRDKNGVLTEPIVLFASPNTETCLGLSVSQLCERTVRKTIANSDALFEPYCERATAFILRNFNRKGTGLRVLVRGEAEREEEEVAVCG
jgi:hypothetical protein